MNEPVEPSSVATAVHPVRDDEPHQAATVFAPGGIASVAVVNLDRQPSRWQRLGAQLERIPLTDGRVLKDITNRVSAVDGLHVALADFSSDVSRSYTLQDFYNVDPQPSLDHIADRRGVVVACSPQELAVAESHLRIWRQVAEGTESILVLEDDAEFGPGFGRTVERAWAELLSVSSTGFDLLYLSYRAVESGLRAERCGDSLIRPSGGLWWMSGYVLSPRGARRLIGALPIVGPIDQWVNLQFERLDVYATREPCILQPSNRQSDNRYSILPVLRTVLRANGSRAEAEVSIEGAESLPVTSSGRPQMVFGIGLNKTGTTSLHEALSLLGFRSCHWISDAFSDEVDRLIENGEELPFEAFTDVASVAKRFRELDRQYPDAAFILTTRALDSWLTSRVRHVTMNRAEVVQWAAPHTWTSVEIAAWKEERLLHHEAVLEHFRGRPGKLLVLDIPGGDGWSELCPFLRVPSPEEPFPRVDPLAARDDLAIDFGSRAIRIAQAQELPHDDLPWISKAAHRPSPPSSGCLAALADAAGGAFQPILQDSLDSIGPRRWTALDDTFTTNLAQFRPANVTVTDDGVLLTTRDEAAADRTYTAGAIASPKDQRRWFRYGRYEAELRPAKADGILTGLFLYRRDPWQEIDLEFLGRDTTKLLANIYFNPGEVGDLYNYGSRGTPVLVDLGFDAADDFHLYGIEWDPSGVRWMVDGEIVYARADTPTQVPDLPMRLYVSSWPINAPDLAGTVDRAKLPVTTAVRSIEISSWMPGTAPTSSA